MFKKYTLIFTCLIFSGASYAKEYTSDLGFKFNLSDDWIVLTRDRVKKSFKESSFKDLGLEEINEDNASEILDKIKNGEVEYIFDKKYSTPDFRNNISIQRASGRTAMNAEEAKQICGNLDQEAIKLYGKNTKIEKCHIATSDNVSFITYEYSGTYKNLLTIQSEFQLSNNVMIVLVGGIDRKHDKYLRNAYNKVLQGLVTYIKTSRNYYFTRFDEAVKAYNSGNYEKAFWAFSDLESIGDVDGIYNLGLMYENGYSVDKDQKTALEYYRRAEKQGSALAINQIANAYLNGNGVTKNLNKAASLYKKSGQMGLAIAQNSYGGMLLQGVGVEQNINAAIQWLTEAAKQGNNHAIQNLIFVYGKYAEKGEVQVMHQLGALYLKTGLPDKAVSWLEKSANMGTEKSRQLLVKIYTNGIRGVESNPEKAKYWKNKNI